MDGIRVVVLLVRVISLGIIRVELFKTEPVIQFLDPEKFSLDQQPRN